MKNIEKLAFVLKQFAGIDEAEFSHSSSLWIERTYGKGDFYNRHKTVCRYLGFAISGVFRSYVIDAKTGEEKNIFLYPAGQFVVTFRSFVNQVPCNYHTSALTDSVVLCIEIDDLLSLYQKSHAWERFGRLLAQEAFNVVIERNESFLFKSPEERYLDLVKDHPDIFNNVPLYHISSYLGIQPPSLSRIRKRLSLK